LQLQLLLDSLLNSTRKGYKNPSTELCIISHTIPPWLASRNNKENEKKGEEAKEKAKKKQENSEKLLITQIIYISSLMNLILDCSNCLPLQLLEMD
jgi:hypothetical protein